ncbi:hypothetical protein F1641_13795 [Quadrisphaera sp. INWT6]|nr:hypothetical protein [Quadrisphaera sp. INWT6]
MPVALAVQVLDGAARAVDDQRVFALGPVESGFLLLSLAGVAAAVVGRWSGVLTLRESLLALALALVLPVVGSAATLLLVADRWRRRLVPTASTGATAPPRRR